MRHFLSCDWGTSSLRLRLAEVRDGRIIAEVRSAEGVAPVYEKWRRSGLGDDQKAGFYLDVIRQKSMELEKHTAQPLKGLTLVLSGMASSSIGFIDLPYASMPFRLDGAGMITALIAAGNGFEHDALIISGAKTDDDVMRGEETQLIGCVAQGRHVKDELFIFPGTHSKHIMVKDNYAVGLKTFMTGEVFSILAQHSILKNTIQSADFDANAFKRGVCDSASGDLLHLIFRARTNGLFDQCTEAENYHYLSGLLIGSELSGLASANVDKINLVCGNELRQPYQIALDMLSGGQKLEVFSADQADDATIKGQLAILKHLKIVS